MIVHSKRVVKELPSDSPDAAGLATATMAYGAEEDVGKGSVFSAIVRSIAAARSRQRSAVAASARGTRDLGTATSR